ncbi:uncharacterized protein LOC121424219 [Lytechinus variegatus]|uniref:uncharacterized protein LOC121424219 n=1 Tax=Lytechinus variegatus TaxID=7654 RepID=UPI001BB15F70|nr:uncharacterized protein LOC121424219 [Lytechinus variegatus]
MINKNLLAVQGVIFLIGCCLLYTSSGNEIVLQESTDDVTITPVNFPNDTAPSAITVKAPSNYRVLLKFLLVRLQKGEKVTFCNLIEDRIISKRLLTLSRRISPPPPNLISPGEKLLITFSRESLRVDNGSFILNATLVDKKAIVTQLGPEETYNLTSPYYPNNYPRLAFSFQTIYAPIGCRLKYRVLDYVVAPKDTMCLSEKQIALNTEGCDVVSRGAERTMSGNLASIWFSSDSHQTRKKGFFVSFTSVGETDDTPCIKHGQSLSPAPPNKGSNTASKQTRERRAAIYETTPRNENRTTQTTTPPWYQYSILQLGGVLLAVAIIAVFLNHLLRRTMDQCCKTQISTMPDASIQEKSPTRTKSGWRPTLTSRSSKYVVNQVGSGSKDKLDGSGKSDSGFGRTDDDADYITMRKVNTISRVPPQRNPQSDINQSKGWTIPGSSRHGVDRGLVRLKDGPDVASPSDGAHQHSQHFIPPRVYKKYNPSQVRKSQRSLLDGDTYIVGQSFDPGSPGSYEDPTPIVFQHPSASQVKLRDKPVNRKASFNRRASVSMFNLTDNDLGFDDGFHPQMPPEFQQVVERESYSPRRDPPPVKRREHSRSSSTDSLPLDCNDRGRCYSPIEQEDRYSTALAKFDVLCNSFETKANRQSPNVVEYVNLPPTNRKCYAATKRPVISSLGYLKPSEVVRALSTSAYDLAVSSSSTDVIDASKTQTMGSPILSNTQRAPTKSNLLLPRLTNSIEVRVNAPTDDQSRSSSDRAGSAYRSYCEIDDIDPGTGMESAGGQSDHQGYNLTQIRLHSK